MGERRIEIMIGKEISVRCKFTKPVRVGRIVKLSKQNWWQQFLIKIGFRLHRVEDVDTSEFKAGDKLYLDPNKPGGLMTK